jgi:hypothetical protein
MLTVIVIFKLSTPITRDDAQRIFLSTAPRYRGVDGLIRKYYLVSEDGLTAGGVYLWDSKAQAQALYTDAWREFVRGKYGSDPTVTYMETPVIVDNLAGQVLSDG